MTLQEAISTGLPLRQFGWDHWDKVLPDENGELRFCGETKTGWDDFEGYVTLEKALSYGWTTEKEWEVLFPNGYTSEQILSNEQVSGLVQELRSLL